MNAGSKRVSLTQYLVEQQREHGRIPAQLRLLIEVVARACKHIAIAVNKGALGDVLGTAHSENVQGEIQKKLDVTSAPSSASCAWWAMRAVELHKSVKKTSCSPANTRRQQATACTARKARWC